MKNLGLQDDSIFIFTSDNGAVYPLSGYDPAETKNVAARHSDIVARLQKVMDEQHVPSKEFPFPLLDHFQKS